jgi:hypothetical protein
MLQPRRQNARTVTVTAPTGGWNARDPLAEMKPTDAVILDNWFCTPTELRTRKGYSEWATGLDGDVTTLIDYDAPSGTEKLFATTSTGKLYDVTSQGAVGSPIITGLSSARWQHVQFATSGGSFLLAVNGADYMRIYDGTTYYTVTGVSTPYAITGIATTSLIDVHTHKRRNWFIQKQSLKCWYLGTDAIAGAATVFDFGPIFELGGSITKIDTWSLDAGYGMDDYFVVITSSGQIAVYKGTDPSNAAEWALVGVYLVGSPVGMRCTCKYGGDVMFLNKDGLIPLSKSLMSSRVNTHLMITDKIQNQIASDTTLYKDNANWDLLLYPPQNMLLVNIPVSSTVSYQYVMNTISGAWSRWTNIPAYCWYFANENLYFGTAGKVCKAWDTQSDNGVPVITDLLPAFSTFGFGNRIKRWTMASVSMGSNGNFAYTSLLNLDFDFISANDAPNASLDVATANWDVDLWDVGVWGTDAISPYTRWNLASGLGYYGAYRIKTSSAITDIRYYSTTYVFEPGGVV